MADDVVASGLKLPEFAKGEPFEVWWLQFRAYANVKGYADALETNFESKLPESEDFVTEDRNTLAAIKKNKLAVASLTMALKNVSDLSKMYKTQDNQYPSGKAYKVIELLKKKYQPDDNRSRADRARELSKITMKTGENPDVLAEQIGNVNNKYANRLGMLEDAEEIAIILSKAPKEYQTVLAMEQSLRGADVTPESLIEVMNLQYRGYGGGDNVNKAGDDDDEVEKDEVLLAALENMNMDQRAIKEVMAAMANKMVCFECGEVGHMSRDCPNKGRNSRGSLGGNENSGNRGGGRRGGRGREKFPGKCHHCGKIGHRRDQCWELPSNAHLRPNNWKSSMAGAAEHNQVVSDHTSRNSSSLAPEVLLIHLDEPKNDHKLKTNHYCYECGDTGHGSTEFACETVESDRNKHNTVMNTEKDTVLSEIQSAYVDEISLLNKDNQENSNYHLLRHDDIWIADTGATVHSTHSDVGMHSYRDAEGDKITVGNGTNEQTKKYGRLTGVFANKDGVQLTRACLDEVAHTPSSVFNLFSISKMIDRDWMLVGNKQSIKLVKGEIEIVFDIKINTPRGCLYCARFKRYVEVAGAIAAVPKARSITVLHAQLGHLGETDTRKTAKALGVPITRGMLKVCEPCAKGKAKRKALPKDAGHVQAKSPGERVFLDISTIKKQKGGDAIYKPNWRLIVDERTELKFSEFFTTKNAMIEPTCEQFHRWKQAGKQVEYLRMDNAGENQVLEKRMNSATWKLNIWPEYTARHTPQQNHLVEVGFHTLANRGRAMMAAARIPFELRYKVARDAFKTATLLDGLMVVTINNVMKTRYEHFSGELPSFAHYLRVFGEAGVVTLKDTRTSKVQNRGETCLFIGYALCHTGNTYRMWNPLSNSVHTTRDITWLNRMYYDKPIDTTRHNDGTIYIPNIDDTAEARESDEIEASDNDRDVNNDINGNTEAHSTTDDDNESHSTSEHGDNSSYAPDTSDYATANESSDDEEDTTTKDNTRTTSSGRAIVTPSRLKDYELGGIIKDIEKIAQGEFQLAAISKLEDDETTVSTDNFKTSARISKAESDYFDAIQGEETLIDEILVTAIEREHFLDDEFKHWAHGILAEVISVGAGIGGGFENTNELRVMKYEEAMASKDKDKWDLATKEEHDKFVKYKVFEAILRKDIPYAAKILTTTWAMKKKANGTHRARINARGFEQVEGKHYDKDSIAAPVTSDVTIRIVLVLMIMAGWVGELIDIRGAFLHGDFTQGEELYMEVPKGFEKHYDPNKYVLLLLKTIYGLRQAAMAFWYKILKCFRSMDYAKSRADPCMYFKWTSDGLIMWISWIDDCLVVGDSKQVKITRDQLTSRFDCDVTGNMNEYVGCKLERNWKEKWIKFTQPVMIQSFKDEFGVILKRLRTPAEPGSVLVKCMQDSGVITVVQKFYRSGVGKLLHMMRWSRPDILNAVRELSKHMQVASMSHVKAMGRVMTYVSATPKRGLTLKPYGEWDGKDKHHRFIISGRSDADYAKDPDNRRSVSGTIVFLNGAPVAMRSGQQNQVTLSTTESELVSATSCAQDMLYCLRILWAMGLSVELPMILEVDNKGTVDLINNWSTGGRTRHVAVRQYFLRDLKLEGLIVTKWISGGKMTSDILTKNLDTKTFEKHVKALVGDDEYFKLGD